MVFMTDPFAKVFKDIGKMFTRLSNMIIYVAERTLSAKDYIDFVNEFTEKSDEDKLIEQLLKNNDKE